MVSGAADWPWSSDRATMPAPEAAAQPAPQPAEVVGGTSNEQEEAQLEALNDWVAGQGLPRGALAYDPADPQTGAQQAVLDLAWPDGLQEELSRPVAVLLNEEPATIAMASQAGFRCFTDFGGFRAYIETVILAEAAEVQPSLPLARRSALLCA
jgi:hypothetical protein